MTDKLKRDSNFSSDEYDKLRKEIEALNKKVDELSQEESPKINEIKIENYVKNRIGIEDQNKLISEYLELSKLSKIAWNEILKNSNINQIENIVDVYEAIESIPKDSNINYHSIKRRIIDMVEKASIEREISRLSNILNSLNRSFYRKKKHNKWALSVEYQETEALKKDNLTRLKQSKMPMKVLTIRINEGYLNRLESIASAIGSNKGELVRDMIAREIKKYEDYLEEKQHDDLWDLYENQK